MPCRQGGEYGKAVVRGLEEAVQRGMAESSPVTDTRHAIIHAQMLGTDHIARLTGRAEREGAAPGLGDAMKAQNFVPSYFINHAYYWGDRHLDTFMGPGRGKNLSPAGWSVAYDQPFALHNDTPVTPISPLRSVQTAVTRRSAPTPTSVPPRPGGTLVSGHGRDVNATALYPAVRDKHQTSALLPPE